jgi:hypothetical protein
MTRRVPVDNVEHARLRIVERASDDARVNQALVIPAEFEQLQREYPILFRRDEDGDFQAVAILGLDRGENLFLSDGTWTARYVPATLRRGPFLLAVSDEAEQGDATLAIDLDDPRVSESEGDPLFLSHGGAAPVLQRAGEALRTVHEGLAQSRAMFALFTELQLIAPVEVDVDLGDGTHYKLADFFTISNEGFAALGGEALERMNRAGLLAAAIHVRSSLGNINRLVELKTRKLASAAHA